MSEEVCHSTGSVGGMNCPAFQWQQLAMIGLKGECLESRILCTLSIEEEAMLAAGFLDGWGFVGPLITTPLHID